MLMVKLAGDLVYQAARRTPDQPHARKLAPSSSTMRDHRDAVEFSRSQEALAGASKQPRVREGELLAGERLRRQAGEPFRRFPHRLG